MFLLLFLFFSLGLFFWAQKKSFLLVFLFEYFTCFFFARTIPTQLHLLPSASYLFESLRLEMPGRYSNPQIFPPNSHTPTTQSRCLAACPTPCRPTSSSSPAPPGTAWRAPTSPRAAAAQSSAPPPLPPAARPAARTPAARRAASCSSPPPPSAAMPRQVCIFFFRSDLFLLPCFPLFIANVRRQAPVINISAYYEALKREFARVFAAGVRFFPEPHLLVIYRWNSTT